MNRWQIVRAMALAGCLTNCAVCENLLWANAGASPKLEWLHGHGTNQGEHVFEGQQTRDGGFIAVGTTREREGRNSDALVVKTDGQGKLQWQRTIGERGRHEEGRCIIEGPAGYYVGGIFTDKGKTGPGMVKLNAKGTKVWKKVYPQARHGAIRGIDLAEGGIVVTGYVDYAEKEVPFIADEGKGFVMKTDARGKPLWRRELDLPQGTKVKTDKLGGGFLVCSTVWRFSGGKDHQDACLVKLNQAGNLEWKKTFGGTGDDQCFDMDLTPDGYILAGHTTSYGKGGWDAWLVKVDQKGNLQWQKSFGQPLGGSPRQIYDECYGVKTTADGGFVLACGSGIEPENTIRKTDPRNIWAAYLVRTDEQGNSLWQYTYHTPNEGHNAAEYVAICKDGGYLMFLDSDTAGDMEEENMGFLKLSADEVGK